jgi:hypothetical protein
MPMTVSKVLRYAARAVAGPSPPRPETVEEQWGVIGGTTGIAGFGLAVGAVYGGKVGAAIGAAAGFLAAGGLIRWPSAREATFRFLRSLRNN